MGMTEDELKQIEEREKAATRGPWEHSKIEVPPNALGKSKDHASFTQHIVQTSWVHGQAKSNLWINGCWWSPYFGSDNPSHQHGPHMDERDAAFIAHSRADIPRLLTEVRFLQSQQRELAAGTSILVCELEKLREDNRRLANENAALVAQMPHGFMFPRDGEARLIE